MGYYGYQPKGTKVVMEGTDAIMYERKNKDPDEEQFPLDCPVVNEPTGNGTYMVNLRFLPYKPYKDNTVPNCDLSLIFVRYNNLNI